MTTTTPIINSNTSLNEIVATHPRLLAVLSQFGLDTCCGGSLSLATAAEHHGLRLSDLLRALSEALASEQQRTTE